MTHSPATRSPWLRGGLRATALAAAGVVALAVPAAATTHPPMPPPPEHGAPVVLSASLSGANEVPVAGGPAVGDPDGSGDAAVVLGEDSVDFALSWKGIGAPTRGHIHIGAAGVNGGVDVPFFEKLAPGSTESYVHQIPDSAAGITGSVEDLDPAVLSAIAADPAGFYVNLHTDEYPGGAVRGQLSPDVSPELSAALGGLGALKGLGGLEGLTAPGAATAAAASPAAATALSQLSEAAPDGTYLASLGSGAQEVPVAGGPAVGDQDGRLATLFRVHDCSVDYALAWSGIDPPIMAHVHEGAAGVNGPVVVPFFDVPAGLPPTVNGIIGSVGSVDAATITGLREHTAGYYANVHTDPYPGGAVRGQLVNLSDLL